NLDVVRDFTDVRDVVRGYRLLAEQGRPGEVYNLGSGRGIRLADALAMLTELAQVPIDVFVDPARVRPVDQPLLVAHPSKLRASRSPTPPRAGPPRAGRRSAGSPRRWPPFSSIGAPPWPEARFCSNGRPGCCRFVLVPVRGWRELGGWHTRAGKAGPSNGAVA